MDWSDDCAYSVHDLEDAIFAGQITVKNFDRDFDTLYTEMVNGYGSDASKEEAEQALARLQQLSTHGLVLKTLASSVYMTMMLKSLIGFAKAPQQVVNV
jgi:dGTP triphosphohydrolase